MIDEENKDIEDVHKIAAAEMPTSSVTYPLKKKLEDLLLSTDTVATLEKVDDNDNEDFWNKIFLVYSSSSTNRRRRARRTST